MEGVGGGGGGGATELVPKWGALLLKSSRCEYKVSVNHDNTFETSKSPQKAKQTAFYVYVQYVMGKSILEL